ncbi:MAG: NUDIX domain-containing protein [bacterium]|nr:NUDIX domain-containing protein [bacterium]
MAKVPERYKKASQTACGIPIQIDTDSFSGKVSIDVLLVYNLGERDGRKIRGRMPGDLGKAEAWGFPAGGIEKGESPSVAMERECRDESGYDVRSIIYEQDEPIIKADVWPNGNIIHFFLLELDDLQGRIKETDEIDAVERAPRWMSVEEFFALPVQGDNHPVAGGVYCSHRRLLESVLLTIAEVSMEEVANWPDPEFRDWLLWHKPAIEQKVAELEGLGLLAERK